MYIVVRRVHTRGTYMSKIKEIRGGALLTQANLATKLGISASAISHFEKGRRFPDINTCWRIVTALNELGANCQFTDVFPNPMNINHTEKE